MSFGSFLKKAVRRPTGTLVKALGGNETQQKWASYLSGVPSEPFAEAGKDKKVRRTSVWSNHDAHAANSEANAAANQENHRVASNINDLHVLFGDYAGPDAGMMSESNTNATARGANYEHYRKAYLDYFSPQLGDQFNTANHNDLFSGIRTGTEGGSADMLRQGATLNKYADAQQQLGSKANSAVNDLQAGDNAREMDLANQIQHGGDAAYLVNSGLRGGLASLASAQDAIPGTALGDVFNNAGNLYEQGQIAQGYGRRGLGMGSSNSGLLTGT